jgi:Txe/YoeB family toxin of toxin-antitoxin system
MSAGVALVKWALVFTKDAQKDSKKLRPPPYEKLVGDLAGAYSRRINIHHRLVYQIFEDKKTVKNIRMWTHYE